MGVISSSEVTVTQQGGTSIAVITWQTDVAADSAVVYGIDGTPVNTIRDGRFITSHSITIVGLQNGTEYYATLAGTDERGDPLSCDAVSPGSSCKITFKTPQASGPATGLSVSANPNDIAKGQTSLLVIVAVSGSNPAAGRTVNFDIHNGNDRGTFSPNPAITGPDGTAVVTFTAAKNGKAQIQVLVDTLSDGVDVMVR